MNVDHSVVRYTDTRFCGNECRSWCNTESPFHCHRYSMRNYNDFDALDKLKTIKRRVSFRRNQQVEPRTCRGWRAPCIPWTSEPGEACCTSANLVCRCNLWMQNCRCVGRTWG
ncbi:hypothetical protein LOTGIDRAFT_161866 [Lottia gigantea]|uniref:Uncharacterized protein n=1 Tax=Lottia gigantea TaxID=225164 RepID=V4ADU6_LOTGI|nr:hypothetical protein LOTGIDRAFT_161866 [Lottia gigantea]ESO93300.1 hypothetical protein LOTGIDRAFT_161866 [Lottia gigantea]